MHVLLNPRGAGAGGRAVVAGEWRGCLFCDDGRMSSDAVDPALVPELLVTDTRRSLEFWCGLCGFRIDYQRPEEGFAYLSRGSAHLMLEQRGIGRNWITGPWELPLGRGINFQISVPALDPILTALRDAEHPLFQPPETKWYRVGEQEEVGVRQFLVSDPDGYLIRFQTSMGRRRPVADGGRSVPENSMGIGPDVEVPR